MAKIKEEPKPAAVKTVGVFNRGRNIYTHGEHRLGPSEFMRVPVEVYEEFWSDITEFGVKVIQLAEGAPAETASAREAQLVAANAELERKLAEAQALLDAATKPAGEKLV